MFFIFLCCSNLEDEARNRIAELYKTLMPKLVNYSKARLIDESYAEDITQTAFLVLIEKYDSLNFGDLNFWILQVVDNLIKNKNRLEKNRDSIITIINIDDLGEELLYYDSTSYVKDIILRGLSETELDFFNTYFVLNESHEVAAKKYNISINASKARKCRIRTRVIRILEENGVTPHCAISK